MKKRLSRNIEWTILICTILLVIIGLFAIYSATENYNHEEFYKQLMWIAIAIPFTIAATLIDYDWISKISPVLYGLILIALIRSIIYRSGIRCNQLVYDWSNINSTI